MNWIIFNTWKVSGFHFKHCNWLTKHAGEDKTNKLSLKMLFCPSETAFWIKCIEYQLWQEKSRPQKQLCVLGHTQRCLWKHEEVVFLFHNLGTEHLKRNKANYRFFLGYILQWFYLFHERAGDSIVLWMLIPP